MSVRTAGISAIPVALALALALAGCADTKKPAVTTAGPPPAATYKVGKPYEINGVWYYPHVDYGYAETGIASWYGPQFDGKATANGEVFDMDDLSAAHPTLPMPSMVLVTNLENGRRLALRVNDRGPFANNRVIDVSRRAAQLLGFEQQGTARVRVEIMEEESRQLAALHGFQSDDAGAVPQVDAAPAGVLTSEALAPPGSSGAAAAAPPAQEPTTAEAAARVVDPTVVPGPRPTGRVTVVAVRPSAIFIQAGAFLDVGNATRLQRQLATLGPAKVVPAVVGDQRFYRVRLGPVTTVAAADTLLQRVLAAGHSDARVIVD